MALYSTNQLEHVACLLDGELEKLGFHLEHAAIRNWNLESTTIRIALNLVTGNCYQTDRRRFELELELIETHMKHKQVQRIKVGGVSIRATDKHSEKVIKCPASGTSLNAECPPLLALLAAQNPAGNKHVCGI